MSRSWNHHDHELITLISLTSALTHKCLTQRCLHPQVILLRQICYTGIPWTQKCFYTLVPIGALKQTCFYTGTFTQRCSAHIIVWAKAKVILFLFRIPPPHPLSSFFLAPFPLSNKLSPLVTNKIVTIKMQPTKLSATEVSPPTLSTCFHQQKSLQHICHHFVSPAKMIDKDEKKGLDDIDCVH